MMRNTSPVGWIPLLILKIFRDRAFFPFIQAAFIVALPIMFYCIVIDSLYYMDRNK
jgi:hypothetical protein